jgi:hypothetical protein
MMIPAKLFSEMNKERVQVRHSNGVAAAMQINYEMDTKRLVIPAPQFRFGKEWL